MVTTQYFTGKEWVDCGQYPNSAWARVALGEDTFNYRTIDEKGEVTWENNEVNPSI